MSTETNTPTITPPRHATDDKPDSAARSNRKGSRIRPIAFWVTTLAVVFELVAGSVWNLLTIEWVEIQLRHLEFPRSFAYVLGAWQVGAAVAIIVPGFRLIKEWAYAGAFFLWSGAVVLHLEAGDGVESWSSPLMFAILAVASWMLRPADRRLPQTRRDHTTDAGQDEARLAVAGPRQWAVALGVLVVLYAVSFLTLPAVEDFMHQNAINLGWITE
ncbi:DoxX-like family protein [Nocardia amikacinitolerans]|uniref:DoxX-like family protein n=1 Tax=Nocardia amikacinitolerans TaxID=756689 RepID=A0A285L0K2_9NOCA|nr:DoxX family protein [Nocardia amikacinitolerans]MCP2296826.1 DoxX-like family protein [Nocardia amikacinitolerans]SNY78440.1 DoxX-like family protein [Nocardia amikacinitolerans]